MLKVDKQHANMTRLSADWKGTVQEAVTVIRGERLEAQTRVMVVEVDKVKGSWRIMLTKLSDALIWKG
jgi:hypothetical protein